MFDIPVSDEILDYCHEMSLHSNWGKRREANGNKQMQLTGMIGECTILDKLSLPLPGWGYGFDGGIDLKIHGITVDVKTMTRSTRVKPGYVCNFIGLQIDYPNQVYIFNSYNKIEKIITVCGWINKQGLKDHSRIFEKGSERTREDGTRFKTFSDLYEIGVKDLHQVSSIDDLLDQIKNYKEEIPCYLNVKSRLEKTRLKNYYTYRSLENSTCMS